MANEWPKTVRMYLNGSKEANREEGEELGLSSKAMENFLYTLYEVSFDLSVNEDGTYDILSIEDNGVIFTPKPTC